jgi:hypothetical protein
MNKCILTAAIILSGSPGAVADSIRSGNPNSIHASSYFDSGERQVDVFTTSTDNGKLGIGAGLNYFFTQFFGAGVETRAEKFDWPNQVNGHLYARYPIDEYRLAPYAFGGFGREFHDHPQWQGHIGGGVDYRFRSGIALFTDIRETFPTETKDYVLWRFGLRIIF